MNLRPRKGRPERLEPGKVTLERCVKELRTPWVVAPVGRSFSIGRSALPLMPERLRRWVLVLRIIAAGFLSGFGFDARHSSRPVLFDRRVDVFFVRASGLDHRVAVILSEFGDPKIFVTVTAVVAVVLILVGDYRAAVAAVGAVALGLVLVEEVLKPFFGRHLAGLAGPTFPSGHTTVAVALAGAVMLAARGGRPLGGLLGLALRRLLMAIAVIVSCAIGLAMVALRLHYMSDVVTGVPLGLAVTGCTAMFVDRGRPPLGVTGRSPSPARGHGTTA